MHLHVPRRSSLGAIAVTLFAASLHPAQGDTWREDAMRSAVQALENPSAIPSPGAETPRLAAVPEDDFWSDDFGPPGTGLGTNGIVWGLAVHEGLLYAGGEFTIAGTELVNHVAAFDGASWLPLGTGTDGRVFCFEEFQGDLIAGGEFYRADGMAVGFIARWDGTNWYPLGSGVNGGVRALLKFGDKLAVGGDFTWAGGVEARQIALWDGVQWEPMGEGFGGGYDELGVRALTSFRNRLIAAGHFTHSGTTSVQYIAEWTGNHWTALDAGLPAAGYALISRPQHFVAGSVVWFAGTGVWEDVFRRYPPWQPLGVGTLDPPFPNAGRAFVIRGGRLIAGGQFPRAAGVTVNYVAKWDGETWIPFGSGCNGPALALATYQGSLFVGGEFSAAGGKVSMRLARWDGTPDNSFRVTNPAATPVDGGIEVSWELSEEVLEQVREIYLQRSENGQTYVDIVSAPMEPAGFMQYLDPGVLSRATYYYRLRLIAASGEEGFATLANVLPLRKRPVVFIDPSPTQETPSTVFDFEVTEGLQPVRLRILDVRGRSLRTLSGDFGPGVHHLEWDHRNDQGDRVARGLYIVSYQAGAVRHSSKLLLLQD